MRVKQYLRWELLLALSLVGCTSVVPNRIGLPQPSTTAAEVQPVAPAGLNLGTRLLFQVRWPAQAGYNAQTISPDTATIEVKIVKGGMDPAAAGAEVETQTMTRPEAGFGDTTTATFNLDPALKTVDVYVRALRLDGSESSSGNRKGVPIRDNTTTGITVTLLPGGNLPDMDKLRIADHLRLLNDLPNYFKDYDQMVHYADSPEVKDLTSSLQTTFGEWMPQPKVYDPTPMPIDPTYNPSPDPTTTGGTPLAPYRTARYGIQAVTPGSGRLQNPSNPSQMMDVQNYLFQKLYWTGYEGTFNYSEDLLKHSLQVNVVPSTAGGGDGTSATLRAELSASSWVTEPSLTPMIDAWVVDGTATSSVTWPITFLGGKKPADANAVTGGRVRFDVTPKGNTANTFSFGLAADTFRDISNTPVYLAATEQSSASRQVTMAPKHVQLTAFAPSAEATADVTLNDDLLGLKSRTDLRVKKNTGGIGAFLLDLGGSMRLGPIGDHTEPVSGNLGFALVDTVQQLRLEGTVQLQRVPFKATFAARFIDVPTNTVIGTIDYDLPVDANGKVDMNHLSSWPVLKLMDAQGSQFTLTPGFFSGETNGYVRVDVR